MRNNMQFLKDQIVALETQHGRNNQVRRQFNRLLRAGSGKRSRGEDDSYGGDTMDTRSYKRPRTPEMDRRLQTLQAQYEACIANNRHLIETIEGGNYAAHFAQLLSMNQKNIAMKNHAVHLLSRMHRILQETGTILRPDIQGILANLLKMLQQR